MDQYASFRTESSLILILRFYLSKNKEATPRISVKRKQFSKLEKKAVLCWNSIEREVTKILREMFFTMYHKLNLQQALDKQMASHFLGKVKFLEVLFINLQSQVLCKKCQPAILYSA